MRRMRSAKRPRRRGSPRRKTRKLKTSSGRSPGRIGFRLS